MFNSKHRIRWFALLPTPKTIPSRDSSLTGRPAGSSSFHRSLTPIVSPTARADRLAALYLENADSAVICTPRSKCKA